MSTKNGNLTVGIGNRRERELSMRYKMLSPLNDHLQIHRILSLSFSLPATLLERTQLPLSTLQSHIQDS